MVNSVSQVSSYAVRNGPGGSPLAFAASSYAIVGGTQNVSAALGYAIVGGSQNVSSALGYAIIGPSATVRKATGYVILVPAVYEPFDELKLGGSFVNVRLPDYISYGSSGGPQFRTSMFELDSGKVVAQPEWDNIRAAYVINYSDIPIEYVQAVESFFYTAHGRGLGFRFKDFSDYQISNQNICVGDGESTRFQLFKRYSSGGTYLDRKVTKIVLDSLTVLRIDGVPASLNVDFVIDPNNGTVTFSAPLADGAIASVDYVEFDVPVRFESEALTVSVEDFNSYSISGLNLIEILL
jgi:uncharacterized protein (TIGR02217 family)